MVLSDDVPVVRRYLFSLICGAVVSDLGERGAPHLSWCVKEDERRLAPPEVLFNNVEPRGVDRRPPNRIPSLSPPDVTVRICDVAVQIDRPMILVSRPTKKEMQR